MLDPASESRFLALWLPTATFSLFPAGFPSGFLPGTWATTGSLTGQHKQTRGSCCQTCNNYWQPLPSPMNVSCLRECFIIILTGHNKVTFGTNSGPGKVICSKSLPGCLPDSPAFLPDSFRDCGLLIGQILLTFPATTNCQY